MTQKEFAKKISEKESTVHQIESGNSEPTIALAKKLQKFLKIRLIESYEESNQSVKQENTEGFTLGDFIKK